MDKVSKEMVAGIIRINFETDNWELCLNTAEDIISEIYKAHECTAYALSDCPWGMENAKFREYWLRIHKGKETP